MKVPVFRGTLQDKRQGKPGHLPDPPLPRLVFPIPVRMSEIPRGVCSLPAEIFSGRPWMKS